MATDYEPDRRGAAIEFRKHLGWYVKGLPGSAELRKKLHAVTSLGEVEGIFDGLSPASRSRTSTTAGDDADGGATRGATASMRREHVRDLLERVADGELDGRRRARRARARARRSRSASRRSTTTARCARDFPKSSTARARRRADLSRSPAQIADARRRRARHAHRRLDAADQLRASLPGVELNARRAHGVPSAATSRRRAAKGTRRRRHRGDERPPVAEEAAVTLAALGDCVVRVTDVGVAGIHRVLAKLARARGGRGRHRRRGDGRRAAVGGRRTRRGARDRRSDERRLWRVVRGHRAAADDAQQLRRGRHRREHRQWIRRRVAASRITHLQR